MSRPQFHIPRNGDLLTQAVIASWGAARAEAARPPAPGAAEDAARAEARLSALGAALAAGDTARADAVAGLAGGAPLPAADVLGAACVAAQAGSVAGVAWCARRLLGVLGHAFFSRPLWAALDAERPGVAIWILERCSRDLLSQEAMANTAGPFRARLLGVRDAVSDFDAQRLLQAWREALDSPVE